MNKCVYRGKIISAEDFAAQFDTETELRRNSGELVCCDPDCCGAVIFRHGVKRVAHFAHKAGNVHCNYSAYIEKMPAIVLQIQTEMLKHIQQRAKYAGYTVDFDVRLLRENKHISNIVLCGKQRYVIDIMNSNKTLKYLDGLTEIYSKAGYTPFPIVVADVCGNFNANADVYYTVRYWLHKSSTHTVLVYNQTEQCYYMCRLTSKAKETRGINVYALKCGLENLQLGENGITWQAFDTYFEGWEKTQFEKVESKSVAVAEKDFTNVSYDYIREKMAIIGDVHQLETNADWVRTLYTKLAFVTTDRYNSKIRLEVPIDNVDVKRTMRYYGQETADELLKDVIAVFGGDINAFRKVVNIMREPYANETDTFEKINRYMAEIPENAVVSVQKRIIQQMKTQIKIG